MGYIFIINKVQSLKDDKYTQISKNMQTHLQTLINEKEAVILQISLAMAENDKIKHALLSNDNSQVHLDDYSLKLKNNTDLKNIWFQIIKADGESFYRSFSEKSGDNILAVREDVAKIVKTPQIISSISTGKFALTFKTMVPIYNEDKFIGIFETLAKFSSIALKMDERKEYTLILVDKSYKTQLEYVDQDRFIDNYYIANDAPDKKLLEMVKNKSVESVLGCDATFTVCDELNSIVVIHTINDSKNNPMAYFIMTHNLDDIDLQEIYLVRNKLFLFFGGFLFTLFLLIFYFLSKKNLIEDLSRKLDIAVESKTKELSYLAHYDTLTNLVNRHLFLTILAESVEIAKRSQTGFSILFLDLDRFKEINDMYGHNAGDKLLEHVALKLKGCIKEQDIVARLGGDEFVILLKNINETNLIGTIEQIISKIQEPLEYENHTLSITFSIGVSSFPKDGLDADVLMRNADLAMYKAKESGRNTYQFYDEIMGAHALEKFNLEKNLKIALAEEQFEAFYQPQIDSATGRILGAEALIRWNSAELGFVSPAEFIPVAEQTKLIIEIDSWMMRRTMSQLKEFQNEGLEIGVLSLNISAKQLESKNMIENITAILKETNFDAKHLELEITEREMMKDPETTIIVLNKIKELGISIAIDDFGTGHSSLAYIKRLPIDKLKIDKSFIDELPDEKEDVAIVRSVISIAKNLQIDIIAEGVETKEQRDFLLQEGCSKVQGYFYSKPLNINDFKLFLLKHNK